MNAVKTELSQCKNGAPQDVKALVNWFQTKCGSKQAMVDAASANTIIHSQEIQNHVQEVWATFFKFDQPVITGQSLGKTAYWALGPVDPEVVQ